MYYRIMATVKNQRTKELGIVKSDEKSVLLVAYQMLQKAGKGISVKIDRSRKLGGKFEWFQTMSW